MADLATTNSKYWINCKINPDKQAAFAATAARLTNVDAVKRYKIVEAKTGVPWWFIAVVHEREASQNWKTQLGQGDPLNRVSTHVPAGRGPFKTWEDGAVDALVNCAPYAARNKDWSVGASLALLEKYNGLGYFRRGKPSPYIWAGTNQYIKGKYVADGVYDENAVDKQLGCAGLLKQMNVFNTSTITPAHTTAGAVIAVGTAAATTTPHNMWWLIPLSIVVGLGVFFLIKYIKGIK